eukprot:Gb_31742 [translate_table: standard]
MPFRLTNALATFMRLMNNILRPFLGKFMVVFLDDIMIFSKNEEEHGEHLQKSLEVLRYEKLYAKLSKCEFCKEEIDYLGHIVSVKGISVDLKKMKAVREWKTPVRVHEVKKFLRLARFKWMNQCQASFDILRQKLTEAPILTLPDMARPCTLFIDASGVAIGAILTQDGKVIAYESRKMNEAERRYPIYDQELLEIVHAIKIWKHYLKNNDFEVVTDHKPLLSFSPEGGLGSRQYRWAMFFEEFRPKIIYRVGKENVVADSLSRIQLANSVSLVEGTLRKEIADAQKVYKWCQGIVQAIENGEYVPNMSVEDGILWYNNRIIVPNIAKLKYKILFELRDSPFVSHVGRDTTYKVAKKYVYWKNMNMKKEVSNYVRTCEQC